MSAHSWLAVLAASFLWPAASGAERLPSPPLEWQAPLDLATGRGERGRWQQNDSRYDFVDDPSVALSERGEAVVAWVDQAKKDVFLQRFSAEGRGLLSEPADVSRSPATFSWLPRVAMVPGAPDKLLVAWQEIIFSGGSHGGDILFARSDDGGRSFSAPLNLSASVAGDGKGRISRDVWHNGSFDLVAGPGGQVHVAWTEYEGRLWSSRSVDGGKTFSIPLRIAGGAATPARAPSLALGVDGALYLAWTVGENSGADIQLAKSVDGGRTFSHPRTVAPSRTHSDAPKLVVDGAGVLHLVYAESSGGPAAGYHIRYASSSDGGRSFTPSRSISAALPANARSAAYPHLAVDGRQRLYVLAELYEHPRQPPRGLALMVSPDGGKNFASSVPVPGSADPAGGFNGSSQGLLMRKLAVNRSGAVAIVNSSLKPAAHSRVWLVRGRTADR